MTETDFQMRMGQFLETEMAGLQRMVAAKLVARLTELGWHLVAHGPALHLSSGYGAMGHAYALWDGDRQESFQLTFSHVATWTGSPRPFAELALPLTWTSILSASLAELDNKQIPVDALVNTTLADVTITMDSFNNVESVILSGGAHLVQEASAQTLLVPFIDKLLETLAP